MLELKLKNLDKLMQAYDPSLVQQALTRSLNRVTGKSKTFVSKEVRQDYNVKARDISKALTITRARKGQNEAMLLYAGGRLGLGKFGARERTVKVRAGRGGSTRKQVRVKVKKTDGLTPVTSSQGVGGFMFNGQIYARMGASRMPIKSLSGPSIAHMVDDRGIVDDVSNLIGDEIQKEFTSNLDYYLMRQIGAV